VRRLLVTGGAGFIGANFVRYWRREHVGDRIVVLDALTYAGNLSSIESALSSPQMRFVHGSICDNPLVERLLVEEGINTIVHFAAESHVDRSISGPDAFIDTNVVGTHSLLKAARKVWLEEARLVDHRFHHVSTDEVYGSLGPDDPPFHEETPYAPNSPYSASKAGSDHLVRAYHHTYGLDITTSNCSNNYGPYQFPEKLIPLTVLNALHGKRLPIYGDGMNVRDWLYVEDHCQAIDRILANGTPGRTYNVGGRSERTNRQVVGALCEIIDAEFSESPELAAYYPDCPAARKGSCRALIEFVPDRPGHDRRYAINSSRIEEELGFHSARTFADGLAITVRWYLRSRSWWAPLSKWAHCNSDLLP